MSHNELPHELKAGDFLGSFGQYGLRPEQVKYEPCFFAYLDILGYKKLLHALGPDAPGYLYEILKNTFEFHRSSYESVKVKLLSDSVLIWSIGSTAVHFWNVVNVVDLVRQSFLKKKLFLRGGISEGPNFIDQDIIISPALIKAWELEQDAKMPRILISEETIARSTDGLAEDNLGQSYIQVAGYARRIHLEQIQSDFDGKKILKSFNDSNGTYYIRTGLPITFSAGDAPVTESQKLAFQTEGELDLKNIRELLLGMQPSCGDIEIQCKYGYVIKKFNEWMAQLGEIGSKLHIER